MKNTNLQLRGCKREKYNIDIGSRNLVSLRTLEIKRNVGRGTPTQCQNPQMTILKSKS